MVILKKTIYCKKPVGFKARVPFLLAEDELDITSHE
jgi:hypothetical protein